MQRWQRVGVLALLSGTIAGIASSAALAVLAKAEGESGAETANATSHWLHGESAGNLRRIDAAHTGVGYVTHHGASVMWASIMEAILSGRRNVSVFDIAITAAGVSALAAAVDYILTPKRFTPGWEEVLTKSSMAGAYAAMAFGLAVGGVFTARVGSAKEWQGWSPMT